jgi:hypothetical protein
MAKEKLAKENYWEDFFYMKTLVTPRIIKLINVIFIILLGLFCFVSLVVGLVTTGFFGLVTFLATVVGSAISYVFLRIFLEISLILFKIEENTRNKKK